MGTSLTDLWPAIVDRANLAPSVHNTQPTRWYLESEHSICLLLDPERYLDAADPDYRDAGLSAGAALEGTLIALNQNGFEVANIEDYWWQPPAADPRFRRYQPVARLAVKSSSPKEDPLTRFVTQRFTDRRCFAPASETLRNRLSAWTKTRTDSICISDAGSLHILARMNDAASLGFMRNVRYRKELLGWMRLFSRHERWHLDGMNRDSLALNSIEAWTAGRLLGTPLFEALDKLGLARHLISEATATRSACAIILFVRPESESPVTTGRAFYRAWLEITQCGLAAWPMAVVADDPKIAAECKSRFAIPQNLRLVNVLRVGKSKLQTAPRRARIPAEDLIVAL